MIRASELDGRAVVDLDAAEKLGRIDKVILNPEARRVAGFVVRRGGSLFGQRTDVLVPASAVHAVGPDAITIKQSVLDRADTDLDGLPRAGDIIGRKVVSTDGRLIGVIDDVLINDSDGRIVGYELTDAASAGKLGHVFGHKDRHTAVLRADVPLRTGRDLVIAPEDAVSEGDEHRAAPPSSQTATPAPASAPGFPYSTTWFQRSNEDDEAPRRTTD